jgi:preprotein translocase subunit SecE
MAKRSTPSADAADEFDGVDDEAVDDVEDVDEDAVEEAGGRKESRGRTAVIEKRRKTAEKAPRRFGFGRIGRFIREVVAELRKVNWPTRKELVTYAVVVVFFVAVLMAIIAGFDTGFAYAVQWVFGE